MKATYDAIETARAKIEELETAYLRRFGWSHTCSTPGSYCLWRRDFSELDAARLKAWKDGGPGPLGWSSKPAPWGVITTTRDLAVDMTRRSLDGSA